jgi:hypothetical protein
MDEPVVGSWWRYARAKNMVFRYEGRNQQGAYCFTRFAEKDWEQVLSTVEIYTLEGMVQIQH